MSIRIAFSGHRDSVCDEVVLDRVADDYPGALWVHGGARGFDTQVEQYARRHGIQTEIVTPDYARWGRIAPIIRNQSIVEGATVLVACYDGRDTGGTVSALGIAKRLRVPFRIVKAYKVGAA